MSEIPHEDSTCSMRSASSTDNIEDQIVVPPLPPEEYLQTVRDTWNLVKDNLAIGDNVYNHLFAVSPTAEKLFRRFTRQSQSRAFMVMLGFVVNGLGDTSTMVPNIIKLGRRHVVYCVMEEDYKAMENAVLEALAAAVGKQWTTEMKVAWGTVFSYIAAIMMSTEKHVKVRDRRPSFSKSDHLECEGWLEKMSNSKTNIFKRGTFSKRWVELRGCRLLFFRKPQSSIDSSVELTAEMSLEDYNLKPFGFSVKGKEMFTFKAGGDIDKDMWWYHIQTILNKIKKQGSDKVVFQGDSIPNFSLTDFDLMKVIGKGSYGKVYKARLKQTGEIFAMKALKKDSLLNLVKYKDLELSAERKILQKIKHPFVVQLHHAFFTETKLYLVMDFLQGGVLLWHMNHRRQQPSKGLANSDVQFYAAEVLLALEHLHIHDIIYRDLKPENLLLDKDGHVVLTDFGLASTKGQGVMMCGSAPFMAPEIVKRQLYTSSVDWWSLGVLMYEMMCGARLFTGHGDEVFAKILTYPIRFPSFFPSDFSDLLHGMLNRDPQARFTGHKIRAHRWFKDMDWELLLQKKVPVPFLPDRLGSDVKYFEAVSQDESIAVNQPGDAAKAGAGAGAAGAAPPKQTAEPVAIRTLLEEFPHNSRVTVLSTEEYGQPIIAPDGSIRQPPISPYPSSPIMSTSSSASIKSLSPSLHAAASPPQGSIPGNGSLPTAGIRKGSGSTTPKTPTSPGSPDTAAFTVVPQRTSTSRERTSLSGPLPPLVTSPRTAAVAVANASSDTAGASSSVGRATNLQPLFNSSASANSPPAGPIRSPSAGNRPPSAGTANSPLARPRGLAPLAGSQTALAGNGSTTASMGGGLSSSSSSGNGSGSAGSTNPNNNASGSPNVRPSVAVA